MKGRAGRIQEIYEAYLLSFDQVSLTLIGSARTGLGTFAWVVVLRLLQSQPSPVSSRPVAAQMMTSTTWQALGEQSIAGTPPVWQSPGAGNHKRLVGAQRRKRRGRPGSSYASEDVVRWRPAPNTMALRS